MDQQEQLTNQPISKPKIRITFKRPTLPTDLSSTSFQHQSFTVERKEEQPSSQQVPIEESKENSIGRKKSNGPTATVKRRRRRTSKVSTQLTTGVNSYNEREDEKELSSQLPSSQVPLTDEQKGFLKLNSYKTKYQWKQVQVKIPTAITGNQLQTVIWKKFPLS